MAQSVLQAIEYITKNFAVIEERILLFLILTYVVYGLVLAFDAYRRYKSKFAPVIVFLLWIVFSIVFLPLYLITRPDIGTKNGIEAEKQSRALLLSSGLDLCPHCGELTERFYRHCQKCGQSIVKYCEICKEPMAAKWEFCVKCGNAGLERIAQSNEKNGSHDKEPLLTETISSSAVPEDLESKVSAAPIKVALEVQTASEIPATKEN